MNKEIDWDYLESLGLGDLKDNGKLAYNVYLTLDRHSDFIADCARKEPEYYLKILAISGDLVELDVELESSLVELPREGGHHTRDILFHYIQLISFRSPGLEEVLSHRTPGLAASYYCKMFKHKVEIPKEVKESLLKYFSVCDYTVNHSIDITRERNPYYEDRVLNKGVISMIDFSHIWEYSEFVMEDPYTTPIPAFEESFIKFSLCARDLKDNIGRVYCIQRALLYLRWLDSHRVVPTFRNNFIESVCATIADYFLGFVTKRAFVGVTSVRDKVGKTSLDLVFKLSPVYRDTILSYVMDEFEKEDDERGVLPSVLFGWLQHSHIKLKANNLSPYRWKRAEKYLLRDATIRSEYLDFIKEYYNTKK